MRIWKGRKKDSGSIHCLGNGSYCVYKQGPDIIQLFGPPYSAPSLFSLNTRCRPWESAIKIEAAILFAGSCGKEQD